MLSARVTAAARRTLLIRDGLGAAAELKHGVLGDDEMRAALDHAFVAA